MTAKDSGLNAAFKAKDARFDGRFFIGISSTGIYCRPICKARKPREENCTFFSSAAAAEQAGYRPCLLCRPELAPGTAVIDASKNLVHMAARLLEKSCGTLLGIPDVARRLSYTDRHLRRVFMAEFKVSPVQYLQTCRLLLAKNLLTDTDLPVLEVAMASGFGSLRRFNALFKQHYHLSPTALKKSAGQGKTGGGTIRLLAAYRPPFLWEELLSFFSARAIPGVEAVSEGEYRRTVRMRAADGREVTGWLRVQNQTQKNALEISLSESLLPVLPQVLSRVKAMFDLSCDPQAVFGVLRTMNEFKPGLCVPGARVPGCFDSFEMAVRAVLGQQVSVKAAGTLAARLVRQHGVPFETGIDGLTHVFPSPETILALGETISDRFGSLGITGARSNTIKGLAEAMEKGEIHLDLCVNPEEEIANLKKIKGIGNWTAQYIAMRALEWPDSFLETDAGIKKALHPLSASDMLKLAESWRPYRSYATISLWNSLK